MKLRTLVFLGVGYVLGARAGQERYEQIRESAQGLARRLESYGAGGASASDPGASDSDSSGSGRS